MRVSFENLFFNFLFVGYSKHYLEVKQQSTSQVIETAVAAQPKIIEQH